MKYIYAPFIICLDEGNSMHSDYWNTQKLLKIKIFNPGTLKQILLNYDVYMWRDDYSDAEYPLGFFDSVSYSLEDNQLTINKEYYFDNNSTFYYVDYDENRTEFKYNVSQIILNYKNSSDDEKEFFFKDDFGYDNLPTFHCSDRKYVYSKDGINKFYIKLLSIYQELILKDLDEFYIFESNKNNIKKLRKQLIQATRYLEMVVANIKMN